MAEIQIPAKTKSDHGESFMAYVAMPADVSRNTPAPVVILIQEIFGVNAEMREKCDEMADAGYIAVCPDLFWRQEPGIQLTDKTEAEWNRAFNLMQNFDIDLGIEDLVATLESFRAHPECNGKIGCVGYCLGGKLAYLMAARSTVDASVGYYGVGLDELLGEAENIKKDLLLHMAEEDRFVSKEAQEKIKAGLTDYANITIHSYPGVNHAFARGNGEHYDETAAHQANLRTMDFLQDRLGLDTAREASA